MLGMRGVPPRDSRSEQFTGSDHLESLPLGPRATLLPVLPAGFQCSWRPPPPSLTAPVPHAYVTLATDSDWLRDGI